VELESYQKIEKVKVLKRKEEQKAQWRKEV
jgi:hypothetical protein